MSQVLEANAGSSPINDWEQYRRDAVRYIIPHFANNAAIAKRPKIFTRGDGCYLFDDEGNRYLDTFASLLTTICGHHRPEVAQAVSRQLEQLEFFPNYEDAYTPPLIELAKVLSEIMPGDLSVTFFVNSGSEANETALKMARQYHVQKGNRHRYKIVARHQSYHGTTLGGISVTGIKFFREYFEPLLPGCIFAPAVRPSDGPAALAQFTEIIEREGPDSISAIIMDPIPGSNTGYPLPPAGYLQGIRELCDRHDIVLIFDEVQTGFGKTGRWFACEHFDVVPDIMTIGKGFSGGFVPLGAAVTTQRIADEFRKPGCELRSGSTYGGHTIACAATLANIRILQQDDLVHRSAKMGDYLRQKLETLYRFPTVGDVRGIGLLQAIELVADRQCGRKLSADQAMGTWIREWCYDNGMILRNNGPILVLAPALVITREQIDAIVSHLEIGIELASKHFGLASPVA